MFLAAVMHRFAARTSKEIRISLSARAASCDEEDAGGRSHLVDHVYE